MRNPVSNEVVVAAAEVVDEREAEGHCAVAGWTRRVGEGSGPEPCQVEEDLDRT